MADNVTIPATGAGDATPIVATDKIGGVDYQRTKIVWGVDGTATDASAAAPLPVVQTGTPGLPTGASTAAKQPALGTAGASSTDVITVQGIASGTAQPISAAALPLPSGAATAAGLTTINTTLGTPLQAGGSVVASGTVTANLGTLNGAATAAKQPALGTAGAASTDVITIQGIASGVAIPVTGGGTPTDVSGSQTFSSPGTLVLSGLNGASTVTITITGSTATGSAQIEGTVDGTNWVQLPFMTGGLSAVAVGAVGAGTNTYYVASCGGFASVRMNVFSLSAGSMPVSMRASAGSTTMRGVTTTVTGTPTVSVSQINGNTAAAGNGVSGSGTQRVTIASDSTGQVVALPFVSSTATLTQVAGSATTVTLIASNASRKACVIVNDSAAILYVAFAASATTAAYTYKLSGGSTLELPVAGRTIYQGLISGIWASATGNAVCTDLN